MSSRSNSDFGEVTVFSRCSVGITVTVTIKSPELPGFFCGMSASKSRWTTTPDRRSGGRTGPGSDIFAAALRLGVRARPALRVAKREVCYGKRQSFVAAHNSIHIL